MRHWALLAGFLVACGSRASIVGFDPGVDTHGGMPRLPMDVDSRVVLGAINEGASAALLQTYTKQAELVAPPVALVPTDGSELVLEALTAKVDIEGPLARTELHFTFHNAEARRREGRFAVTLPPTASVARFAMKIGGVWREARVVSRMKGREVYETILKERRDPALLERDLGNVFSARVFPIEVDEHKQIVLAYEHAVGESQPYVLALRGLPAIPKLTVEIDRDGTRSVASLGGRAPEDVVVPIAAGSAAVASGDAFVARVELPATAADAKLERVLILVDTSASRATVMAKQAAAVRAIVAALPAGGEVAIAAYDHAVTELYRGDPSKTGDIAARLFAVSALGASDLHAALAYAARSGMPRVILVGDGMATLGEREPVKLARAGAGIARIDALQVGATIDRDTLGMIVAAGESPGAILDGRDLRRAVQQLAQAIPTEQRITVDGATTWPATTRGVAPGDPVWVFGRRAGQGALRVRVGARAATITPVNARRRGDTRVQRAVAGAEVAELTGQVAMATKPEQRVALATRIEKLALEHALVSMQTSLLVLESDADEQRFRGDKPVETAQPPKPSGPPRTFGSVLAAGGGSQSDSLGVRGEVIVISGSAPIIDPTSTSQGITIDREYIRNIPLPGRAYDGVGLNEGAVNLSGASSLENTYIIDGTTVLSNSRGAFQVKADVMSPLANELIARSIRGGGMFSSDSDDDWVCRTPTPERTAAYDPWSYVGAPHAGEYLAVRTLIAGGESSFALETATAAELANPGDITAILALGEALEARGAYALAARAYGSLIDLYPNRAELLRAAGERLDAIAMKLPAARDLAIDAYRRAIVERPDHAHTYRLLALSLLLADRADADDEVLPTLRLGAAKATQPAVLAVIAEDRAVAEAVLAARHPERATELLGTTPVALSRTSSLRIILAWETDANDVDLHIRDRSGVEAFYSKPTLPSGGTLLQDITSGYGPEMFTIIDPKAFPYRIGVHYYSRGPMGVGLGTVQAVRHDGNGRITVTHAPFVIQNDQAMIELPSIAR